MSNPINKMRRKLHMVTKKQATVLITALVIGAAALFWHDLYLLIRYQDLGEREANAITYKIRDVVQVPSESPALATVKDESQINRGGVLQNAKNGDKVLLFYKSATAMLYRPSSQKIVAVGPLVLDASAAQVKGARVEVRNGSGNNDKYQRSLDTIRKRYPSATVIEGGEAVRSTYPKTIIVDLSGDGEGSKAQFTSAIVELTGAQTGVLPLSETKPNADILIITGIDE